MRGPDGAGAAAPGGPAARPAPSPRLPAVDAVVLRCLEKDASRYSGVSAFLAALMDAAEPSAAHAPLPAGVNVHAEVVLPTAARDDDALLRRSQRTCWTAWAGPARGRLPARAQSAPRCSPCVRWRTVPPPGAHRLPARGRARAAPAAADGGAEARRARAGPRPSLPASGSGGDAQRLHRIPGRQWPRHRRGCLETAWTGGLRPHARGRHRHGVSGAHPHLPGMTPFR